MMQFLLMGGYAVYVWPAVALAIAVLALNVFWARRTLESAQREARRRLVHGRREPV
jgi:heme exporter protein CcmD